MIINGDLRNNGNLLEINFMQFVNLPFFLLDGFIDLKKYNFTQRELSQIATHFHSAYIGDNPDFRVDFKVLPRDKGLNGFYTMGSERITICSPNLNLRALHTLLHEFYHHYQYVAIAGIGNETYKTLRIKPELDNVRAWQQDYVDFQIDPIGNWYHPLEVGARDFAQQFTGINLSPPWEFY